MGKVLVRKGKDNDEEEVLDYFFARADLEEIADRLAKVLYPHEVETLVWELRRLHAL